MAIRRQLFHLAGRYMFNRPGGSLTIVQHHERLIHSGNAVTQAIAQARPTPDHQRRARHIIGIERWALVRLGSFLEGIPPHDEYDGYQPAAQLTLPELADVFGAVRADVVAFVGTVPESVITAPPVLHNDFGALSMGGWLRYIELHARMESKKLGK